LVFHSACCCAVTATPGGGISEQSINPAAPLPVLGPSMSTDAVPSRGVEPSASDAAAQERLSASLVAVLHCVTQWEWAPGTGWSTRTAHGMHHATDPAALAAQAASTTGPDGLGVGTGAASAWAMPASRLATTTAISSAA
jgi:hypothetical protein